MRVVVPALALGALTLLGLHEWKGISYWNYSEGVYALTARALLDGADLYDDVVAAQPPIAFLAGAGALAVEDGLRWLRLAVGLVQLVAALLAALAVYRLTENRGAAVLTVPAGLLLPWAVYEHGQLTPETIALPLLMGGALLAARHGSAAAGAGGLLALAVWTKFSFVLPAAAVLAVASDRRAALTWGAGSLAALVVVSTAVFGPGLWRDAVQAQLETGARALSELPGLYAQAGWNLLGLLVASGAAVALRRRAADPLLFRTLAALGGGALLTSLTIVKRGTEVNILVAIELALLPLAVAGVVWALSVPRLRIVVPAAAALALAQGVGLVVGSGPFLRPFSAPAYGAVLTSAEVEQAVAVARRCPPDTTHGGTPFTAFLARRPMADGQPDQFITAQAEVHADVLAAMHADGPHCPPPSTAQAP